MPEDSRSALPRHSVVLPLCNRADSLPDLAAEIVHTMSPLTGGFECLLVDDGSTDETPAIIERLARAEGSPFRALRFRKQRGHATALYFGLWHACGELIVVMDGEVRHRPEDVRELVACLEENDLDLVCGVRADRRDSWMRRVAARVAIVVSTSARGERGREPSGGLTVMRRAVVTAMPPIRTLSSVMPLLALVAGFRIGEHPIVHPRHGSHARPRLNLIKGKHHDR